jgi:perosamine synthetase
MDKIAPKVTEILKEMLLVSDSFIPLHIPEFDDKEVQFVNECIRSNFVSSVGSFVDRFEEMLQTFTGAKRCVLCVNGTSALHLVLHSAGIGFEDEVLIPSFTFIATANAVSYCGASPHFIDIEEKHLGVDPTKLSEYLEKEFTFDGVQLYNPKTKRKVKALVPMHTFGHPCKMSELLKIANSYNLLVIEDAAESLGSYYKDKHTGNAGLCGVLSFNGNKIITSGGGGAILSNDIDFAHKLKHLSTTAKEPHKWEIKHDNIGYNYRMPAINAALGCAQMEKVASFISHKRKVAEMYFNTLKNVDGLRFVSEREDSKSNYWLNTIILDDASGYSLGELLKRTNDIGIMTRPAWTPLHLLPIYSNCPKMDLEITENMFRRVINIPSSARLGFTNKH